MASAPSNFQIGAAVPLVQVELSISCRNLADMDVMSKSDPMCVVYNKSSDGKHYTEIGRTEWIANTLNPDFVKKFIVDYYFEESQRLKFEVYDIDDELHISNLHSHDFLGYMECTLGEIVSASKFERPLLGISKKTSSILVRAEEVSKCKEIVTMRLAAQNLEKYKFFGKSDPFLELSRCNEDGSYTVVHRTEVEKDTVSPVWRPFSLKGRLLCNGDYERSIKIDCLHYHSNGDHELMGSCLTNLRELSTAVTNQSGSAQIEFGKPSKKGKKSVGSLLVQRCVVETEFTFLDYIQGGMQLHFTVAIDFTASNGDPRDLKSLHYMGDPTRPNQYTRALCSVGEIIQDYDSDKMFPALGFGARFADGKVSHEFSLNGNPSNPFCAGISGILQAYQAALMRVQLYGPTCFAPVVNHVANFAKAYQDGGNFFILLIITDGVINDMPQTKSAIVNASRLPMAIIIVGVGEADFDAMVELDSDDGMLKAGTQVAERDIVQFVPFRQFTNRHDITPQMVQFHLAKEVLAEIPEQITGYMRKRGIRPGQTKPAHLTSDCHASAPPL